MLLFALLACTDTPTPADTDTGYTSDIYAELDHWLCHPDKPGSICAENLDTTVVHADGTTELRPHVPAADPPFDCFYVYPTVSGDTTVNSDLEPGVEEEFTTLVQFARYGAVCRQFAPVYRQLTLSSLFSGADPVEGFAMAYADVDDAWRHYLAQHNDGRPVLLVGHSQGSIMLRTLLGTAIEPQPDVHERIVGAHLIGMTVQVPPGALVGGDLASTPLCTSDAEWGCVTTYLSFRPDDPPGPDVFVGQPFPGREVPCTHPGAIAAGSGPLDGVFPTTAPGGIADMLAGNLTPWQDPSSHPAIDTPFFAVPGLVQAECRTAGDFGYLSVEVPDDPSDVRFDDVDGDFFPGWGLHVIDVNLAMDDLVALAQAQFEAR
ncbi:MAG: DUF3089 domain-containing protein [Alphaproteobacteria bacterium]|nr:DUF3089 domain-containing protein [Alphaproteobacteria bacterium]